jgi:hypothetical protein
VAWSVWTLSGVRAGPKPAPKGSLEG